MRIHLVSVDGGVLVLGQLIENTSDCVILKDPKAIQMVQNQTGVSVGISNTNFMFSSHITIYRSYIAAETEEENIDNSILKAYIESTTNIKIASKNNIIGIKGNGK